MDVIPSGSAITGRDYSFAACVCARRGKLLCGTGSPEQHLFLKCVLPMPALGAGCCLATYVAPLNVCDYQVWNDARLSWCACVTLGFHCLHDESWGFVQVGNTVDVPTSAAPPSSAAASAAALSHTGALSLIHPCVHPVPVAETANEDEEDAQFPGG